MKALNYVIMSFSFINFIPNNGLNTILDQKTSDWHESPPFTDVDQYTLQTSRHSTVQLRIMKGVYPIPV